MPVSSLAHLPEPVLYQLLGGLLLTHFRSGFADHADLYIFRDHEIPLREEGDFVAKVDWAIYNARDRRIVAVYELVRSIAKLKEARPKLKKVRAALRAVRVGVVMPASLAIEGAPWATAEALEVVTYPA